MANDWTARKRTEERRKYQAVTNLLGGDDYAYRTARRLATHGIANVAKLRARYEMTMAGTASHDEDLRWLTGIGPEALARIAAGLKGPSPRVALDSHPDSDPSADAALTDLTDRALGAYLLALQHSKDPASVDNMKNAMREALQFVAPGFAAATLQRVSEDLTIPLTDDHRKKLSEQAANLDRCVVEILKAQP